MGREGKAERRVEIEAVAVEQVPLAPGALAIVPDHCWRDSKQRSKDRSIVRVETILAPAHEGLSIMVQ